MAGTGIFGDRRSAEDGMIPVIAGQSAAKLAPFAQADNGSADLLGVPVVPAPHLLGKVAAYGSHVPDVRTRHAMGRLSEERVVNAHLGRSGDIGKARERADPEALCILFDVVKTFYGLYVDHRLGVV